MTTSAEVLSDLKFMKMKVFGMFITTELASITLACLCLGDDRCAGRAGLHKPKLEVFFVNYGTSTVHMQKF